MKAVFNKHYERGVDFTLEFNVKNPSNINISEDLYYFEIETGIFTNKYGERCFNDIKKILKNIKLWNVSDFYFGGRSGGWFILSCFGNEESVTQKQLGKIETIVDSYYKNYGKELSNYYNK